MEPLAWGVRITNKVMGGCDRTAAMGLVHVGEGDWAGGTQSHGMRDRAEDAGSL